MIYNCKDKTVIYDYLALKTTNEQEIRLILSGVELGDKKIVGDDISKMFNYLSRVSFLSQEELSVVLPKIWKCLTDEQKSFNLGKITSNKNLQYRVSVLDFVSVEELFYILELPKYVRNDREQIRRINVDTVKRLYFADKQRLLKSEFMIINGVDEGFMNLLETPELLNYINSDKWWSILSRFNKLYYELEFDNFKTNEKHIEWLKWIVENEQELLKIKKLKPCITQNKMRKFKKGLII